MTAFARSVWLSVSGWNAVDNRPSLPGRPQSRCQNTAANCVPRSETMLPASLEPEHLFDEEVYPSGSVDACPAWDDMAGMMVGHEAGGMIALGAR